MVDFPDRCKLRPGGGCREGTSLKGCFADDSGLVRNDYGICGSRKMDNGRRDPADLDANAVVDELYRVILSRRQADPATSYVARLFARGSDRILQKVGEEAIELLLAAKNRRSGEVVAEVADLIFHLLVLLADQEIPPAAVRAELERRRGCSGLTEKAARN